MPEAPEIKMFSIILDEVLKKKEFIDIEAYTKNQVDTKKIQNGRVVSVDCNGKLLWIKIRKNNRFYYIHIHLGLTGWFYINEKPQKYIKYVLKFKGRTLYIEDKRRFSKCSVVNEKQHKHIVSKLGVSIFDKKFTYTFFKKTLENKKGILASFLLKQNVISGIGNYIKNEVLYLTNLDIKIKINKLDKKSTQDIYKNIIFVAYSNLFEMVKEKGYRIPKDIRKLVDKQIGLKNLDIPYVFRIYSQKTVLGRKNGEKIYKAKVSGRDSYYTKNQGNPK